MKHIFSCLLLTVVTVFSCLVGAAVTPEAGGFRVSYDINLGSGTSNGSDIEDILIFEWNSGGDSSVVPGSNVAGQGRTVLSHVIGFKPTSALLIGWGAGVTGVGDGKDHIFTIVAPAAATSFLGNKWSVAFPGIPPAPRTGHSAMIGLLKDVAAGDPVALAAVTDFVQREAVGASFNPAGIFRVVEWSFPVIVGPPPPPLPTHVPVMPSYGLWLLMLGLSMLAWRSRIHPNAG